MGKLKNKKKVRKKRQVNAETYNKMFGITKLVNRKFVIRVGKKNKFRIFI